MAGQLVMSKPVFLYPHQPSHFPNPPTAMPPTPLCLNHPPHIFIHFHYILNSLPLYIKFPPPIY